MLFKKENKKVITVDGKQIELQPKPKKGIGALFSFGSKKQGSKPAQRKNDSVYFKRISIPDMQAATANSGPEANISQSKTAEPAKQQVVQPTVIQQPRMQPVSNAAQPRPSSQQPQTTQQKQQTLPPIFGRSENAGPQAQQKQKQSPLDAYIRKLAIKNRKVEDALKDQHVKGTLYDFIKRMLITSIMISIVMAITIFLLFMRFGVNPAIAAVLAFAIGLAVNQFAFRSFMGFPLKKSKKASKNVERDILFAARDMIISLRSGMPLYNAIVSVSTGYGDASAEFARITQRVQLGMPLEEAIDQTTAETRSSSFRKIMLQASVSIKAGANVVNAMQSVIDELSEERVIALRKYGQRLNAIAMFYMLFGVILPSMGIAIATILTTFISIFTVNVAILEGAIVGLIFMQLIFLQLIRGSRPVFAM